MHLLIYCIWLMAWLIEGGRRFLLARRPWRRSVLLHTHWKSGMGLSWHRSTRLFHFVVRDHSIIN